MVSLISAQITNAYSPSDSIMIAGDELKTKSDESENIVEFMNKQIIRPGKGVASRVSADTLVESHFFANLSFTFTKLAIIWKRTNALRIICRIFEITKSSIFTMGTSINFAIIALCSFLTNTLSFFS